MNSYIVNINNEVVNFSMWLSHEGYYELSDTKILDKLLDHIIETLKQDCDIFMLDNNDFLLTFKNITFHSKVFNNDLMDEYFLQMLKKYFLYVVDLNQDKYKLKDFYFNKSNNLCLTFEEINYVIVYANCPILNPMPVYPLLIDDDN